MKLIFTLLSLAVLTARGHIQVSLQDDIFTESDCTAGVAEGPIYCNAYFPIWRYDIHARHCVRDSYGGCFPTKNNFKSLKECETVTKPVCQHIQTV
ncbi:trypsin inhibitor-like isoform X1 [Diabrotica virgifera virgifera]|uniref:BPTI/Kunitz inhibitor domain-containing protein n=1 Tax=Diabrotica virgifera virgifera TaxID=50390 RepID=A0ABM5KDU7_DIAVI|nr:trypsin inhibitor-like isoform X1 [Diabrotica virgifera virgifera]